MKPTKLILSIAVIFILLIPTLYAQNNESISSNELLNMPLEDMMNVKISTAGKKSEKIADIPASVVLITRKEIEKYGYMTLEEILENVLGMYVIDDLGAYRKTYGVRGFYTGTPRNIIFLVNGVSQAEGVFDFNVMANFYIPVEAIDRIEVVRGPMSVMYGQGAFFGAINIITNDSYDETNLAAVSYGNMSRKAAAKIAGTRGDFRYSLSAGYTHTDGPDHALSDMVSDMSTLSPWKIDSTNDDTEDRLEREATNIIFSGEFKSVNADIILNHSPDETIILRPALSEGSVYERDSAKVSLGFKKRVTEDVKIDLRAIYHYHDFTLDWDLGLVSFTGSDPGTTSGAADMLELELNTFIDVNENLDLTTGLYYKQYMDPEFSADINIINLFYDDTTTDDIQLWAAFAQANLHPWEKLRFVGGIRVEQMFDYTMIHNTETAVTSREYDEDDLEFTTNLAALYSFSDRQVLKLMYGKAFARPSFFQNRDQLVRGYPNLESEEIQTFELNYNSIVSPEFTWNASVFYNILDNLIVRTNTLSNNTLIQFSSNQGELITKGVELSMQVRPVKGFLADLGITYQDTEDQRDGFEDIKVAYSPNLLGYAKLSYEFDHTIVSVTVNYVDDMESEYNEATNTRIGAASDSYFLLGANIRVNDLLGSGVYLNARCSNLLDKEYYYPTYVNNPWADKGTLGNTREILVTLGYKF